MSYDYGVMHTWSSPSTVERKRLAIISTWGEIHRTMSCWLFV